MLSITPEWEIAEKLCFVEWKVLVKCYTFWASEGKQSVIKTLFRSSEVYNLERLDAFVVGCFV